MPRRVTISCFTLACALWGCSEASAGEGTVTFTTWGEDYIEVEIPAAPPAEEGLVDGWTLRYSKFLAVVRDVAVADHHGEEVARMDGSLLVDQHSPGSKEVVTFTGLPAGALTQVSYELGPADATTALGPGATQADLDAMVAEGLTFHIVGTASKGDLERRFDWRFAGTTRYHECKAELDGKETYGVVVTNGGTDTVELTMHGDHFFYDDLEAATAERRFAAVACADADLDGDITLAELAESSLLPDLGSADADCSTRPVYRPGSQSVNELGTFVQALSRTVGHYRGEGECVSTKVD